MPLHVVDLQSSLVSGLVMIGLVTSLPVQGVSLILRNDLAGDHVIADPCLFPKPCLSVVSDNFSNEISNFSSLCSHLSHGEAESSGEELCYSCYWPTIQKRTIDL